MPFSCKRTLISCALLSLSTMPFAAHAFNIDGLVNAAVQAATQEVGKAISTRNNPSSSNRPSTSSSSVSRVIESITDDAQTVTITKPKNWPSKYHWYAYDRTAVQPVNNGKVRAANVPGWVDGLQYDSLPFQHAIVRVHGDGSRKLAIFSDPYCPASKVQERELNKLDNVTIYTFVAPLLSPKSEPMVKQITCQPTNQARAQAWDNWILNGVKPPKVANCSSSSSAILQSLSGLIDSQGRRFNQVSPIVVFESNIAVGGAVRNQDLYKAVDLK